MKLRHLCVAVLLFANSAMLLAQEQRVVAQPDAFKTLVNPMCSHCRDEAKRRASDLRADDRVLCWIRGYSDGGVIPYRFFLNPYGVISDTYGVFVYDPDAGYARGFVAEALTATTFAQCQKQIKPQPGESRWMDVPWFIDLHEARQKAAAEGKPLFIYASGGSISIGSC